MKRLDPNWEDAPVRSFCDPWPPDEEAELPDED